MRKVLRGGLAAGLVLAAVVAVPGQAAALECVWNPTVLPLPPGATNGTVNAADGDGWFAGWTGNGVFDRTSTAIWHGDEVVPIGHAFGLPTVISGIDPAGTVVVGAVSVAGIEEGAVIYRDGAWHRLPESGDRSWSYDVNAAGDTIGTDLDRETNTWNLVVWPDRGLGTPRMLPPPPNGAVHMTPPDPRIDDDGTVIAAYDRFDEKGYVWTPGASEPTRLMPLQPNGIVYPDDIRNGRIVGRSASRDGSDTIGAEWNLAGQIVRTFPVWPFAVNADGVVVGRTFDTNVPVVLGPDETIEPVLAPEGFPDAWTNGFADTMIGGYAYNGRDKVVPVRWQRSC